MSPRPRGSMEDSSRQELNQPHQSDDVDEAQHGDEEVEGLLSGMSTSKTNDARKKSTRGRRIQIFLAVIFLSFCFGLFIVVPAFIPDSRQRHKQDDVIMSNGTHEYRKTVLMVSIDGLRADYLDRGLTPHLLEISREGLRAKYMKPVFPTLTFPNHWALMTGLYPESHGIIANEFYDPRSGDQFVYSDPARSWNASWWYGEPIWATANKAGIITANLMWPGPPTTSEGISPTYYVPFKDKVAMPIKLNQITDWLEMPFETRPQLILAYEPSLDQAGHLAGPGSDLVNHVLTQVDEFARDLHQTLAARNLTDIVDIIFVSDHGMVDTSNVRLVYLDDILGEDGMEAIKHEDGWPSVGLRFSEDSNTTEFLSRLYAGKEENPEAISVYTPENMPDRWHFDARKNDRIAPIYVVPHLGWAITNHHEHEVVMGGDYDPKGNHGYDNDEPSMHAMFVADGPFSVHVKRKRGVHMSHDGLARGETYVMEGFMNLEIYGLVARLLGIQSAQMASNNGTADFWAKYLD